MAGIYDVLENQIPILLNQAVMNLEPKMTVLFRTMVSSEGMSNDPMSRNWSVRKLVKGSMAGVIQADDTPNVDTIYGATVAGPARMYANNGVLSEYPDPTLGVAGRTATMTFPIRAFRGSFELTLGEIRHDTLPALVGQIVADKVEGVAQQAVYQRAAHVWADDEYGLIGTLAAAPSAATTGSQNSAFTAAAAGTYTSAQGQTTWYVKLSNDMVNRFAPGMIISMTDPSDSAVVDGSGNVLPFYVKWVDRLTDRMAVFTYGDYSAATGVGWLSAGRFKLNKLYTYKANPNGTTSRSVDGVNAWLKQGYDSGGVNYATSIYGLTFADWPEMQSFTYEDSGNLTEEKLGRYMDRLTKAAIPHGFSIDTLVMNSATFRPYANQKIGYSMIPRTGSPINLGGEGVSEGFAYHHNGRTYTIMTDEFVADGQLYGLKIKNNIKRYVPPRTPGAGSQAGMPAYLPIEFVNPLLGGSSIFDQKRGVNNIVTEMKYAPFDYRMNVIPDQLFGMKITGLSTNKLTPA
jgi:hypothetical protein